MIMNNISIIASVKKKDQLKTTAKKNDPMITGTIVWNSGYRLHEFKCSFFDDNALDFNEDVEVGDLLAITGQLEDFGDIVIKVRLFEVLSKKPNGSTTTNQFKSTKTKDAIDEMLDSADQKEVGPAPFE